MYDVIVVGAGPGGSTAAYHLARAGLKTLLLEKEKMPRYKPCGGGVTAKVKGALDCDISPTIEQTITGASVAYGTERMRLSFKEPVAWCVMRDKFDFFLAQRAADAGAEVREAHPVKDVEFDAGGANVHTRGETLHAQMVVGADGVNGIVRRAAGFPAHRRLGVALEAEMEAPDTVLEEWQRVLHFDFGAIAWGYAWIFPKADHLSAGIGALIRRNCRPDLRAELARYVGMEPSLHAAKERLTRGHRVPLGGQFDTYHGRRVLLVGDAAGVVDPFTAEGIYYAIRSGQIAAEEIVRAFQRGAGLDVSPYTGRINAEINSDFRYAWVLTQIFFRTPHLSYRIFRRSKFTQDAASKVVTGLQTYSRMMLDIVKNAAWGVTIGRSF